MKASQHGTRECTHAHSRRRRLAYAGTMAATLGWKGTSLVLRAAAPRKGDLCPGKGAACFGDGQWMSCSLRVHVHWPAAPSLTLPCVQDGRYRQGDWGRGGKRRRPGVRSGQWGCRGYGDGHREAKGGGLAGGFAEEAGLQRAGRSGGHERSEELRTE